MTKDVLCRDVWCDKSFVVTKIILMAAPANDAMLTLSLLLRQLQSSVFLVISFYQQIS